MYTKEELEEVRKNCVDPRCTRIGSVEKLNPNDPESLRGTCVGYHCHYCGEPCGSIGHPDCLQKVKDREQEEINKTLVLKADVNIAGFKNYIVNELDKVLFDVENHVNEDEIFERISKLQDYIWDFYG